jgi:hypothetical protein
VRRGEDKGAKIYGKYIIFFHIFYNYVDIIYSLFIG